MVTETLTSDVVTTSTDAVLSEHVEDTVPEPWAINIRVDVMSTTVTPVLDATAVGGRSPVGDRA